MQQALTGTVSIVLPTYNRAAALQDNLPALLEVNGVDEVLVVDDGSVDATAEVLAGVRNRRLRVLRLARNCGSPTARNTGAANARGTWVLFAEDDCRFPADYAQVLAEDAEVHGADIVGAPMVWVGPDGDVAAAVRRRRAAGGGTGGLDEVAGFPRRPLRTPLLPAPALVRRTVFRRVRFDPRLSGNAYREETDFFLRAEAAGHACLLTDRTFFWEAGRYGGGQPRPLLRAEWWTLRNNARFLRRHADTLQAAGLIASPMREQIAFAARRLGRLPQTLRERQRSD